MAEDGGRKVEFPVVFFDGEREMDIGYVAIGPEMQYKPFQLMLAQKIGISPNQISIYFVDRNKSPKPPFSEERRRFPVTGKVNFAAICRMKECSFLAVLKRSRKSRNRRMRHIGGVEFGDCAPEKEVLLMTTPEPRMPKDPPVLLRRNHTASLYTHINPLDLDVLNGRLRSLMVQRNYQAAIMKAITESPRSALDPKLIADLFTAEDGVSTRRMSVEEKVTADEKALCEDCCNAAQEGNTTSFHLCINDTVITRFSTRLGPINRPANYP
ncbi:hypothetical protein M569_06383 [Genlisea aurea]|uniref:DUF7138 domain-containing protein n=1 Tax=Genlisea aurea TaxID=192259 RepID=S8CML4_9LAMI|nr:hypothetical protein M569_06383 [Genlisea aurea]